MRIATLDDLLKDRTYPGRGIVVGTSPDGESAYVAYFLTGRSANSRNRVLQGQGEDVVTAPYRLDQLEDPSLIIYRAIRNFNSDIIVTNGDQTDTIYEGLQKGIPFREALKSRQFEPDAPNFTPRISAILHLMETVTFEMSILKAGDSLGTTCHRYTFDFESIPGEGRLLHTYEGDGSPLPTFKGEPRRVSLPNTGEVLASQLWESLDVENRIALYVREVHIVTHQKQEWYINKYES